MTAKKNAGARGQRRGFYWQDWYAAWEMLRAVVSPDHGVVGIEVEAADAPHVDDVVIHKPGVTVYRQLKHKIEGRPFVGSDLFGSTSGAPEPLIRKLFLGWTRVATKHAGRVEIRLTTNAPGSAHPKNKPISPVDFSKRILENAREPSWRPVPEDAALLDQLGSLAGAPDAERFRSFLACLGVDYGEPDETALKREVMNLLKGFLRPHASLEQESMAWAERVYDLSTRYGVAKVLSRDDIAGELRAVFGHQHRVEHRLALPEHHVPRAGVREQILEQARAMETGYILVVGPPGCGKTTLATSFANEYDDEVIVRYHAFDSGQTSGLERKARASAGEFLSTMFDVLADRFPGTIRPCALSGDRFSEAAGILRNQLASMSGGETRFVVVDGIDHVIRAGLDRNTLFDALPQVAPNGLVFVLFGQPDWAYPEWLKRSPRIEVPPFSKSESCELICRSFGWPTGDPHARVISATVHEKSAGNPLSLFYSLRVLHSLGTTAEAVADGLSNAVLFGVSPQLEYERLLDDLQAQVPAPQSSSSLLRDMLACVAVATSALTQTRLRRAFSDDDLTARQAQDFLEGLRPVVVERTPGSFWLFHDDFRRHTEEQMSSEQAVLAHSRFAAGLESDWERDELGALAEHQWLGKRHRELAGLPSSQTLEDWFERAPAAAVVKLHRFALAAALGLADDLRIMENSLALSRAQEAADLPWSQSGPAIESGLKPWASIVAPAGVDLRSLERCAHALRVAAASYSTDPVLASDVAARFGRSLETLKESEDLLRHGIESYVEAHVDWLLHSGDLSGVGDILAQEVWAAQAFSTISTEFSKVRDPSLARQWSQGLVGLDEDVDRAATKAATMHILEGRDDVARHLVEALLESATVPRTNRRDATILLSLLEGELRTDESYACRDMRWDQNFQPTEWRDFFFRGFARTARGSLVDLGKALLPPGALDGQQMLPEHETAARDYWKAGSACGLAMRKDGLLPERELAEIVRDAIPDAATLQGNRDGHVRLRSAALILPMMARAVQNSAALSSSMGDKLVEYAALPLEVPAVLRYGCLEAIWSLRPETWRRLARAAYPITTFPKTEAYERTSWCQYWLDHGGVRGVPAPQGFAGFSQASRLGVPRKTDPAALAVSLLCDGTDNPHVTARIEELVTLLIRLGPEPEGGRAASRQLPRVLAYALDVDPALFAVQFRRCTADDGVVDAFGTLPAEIASYWLAAKHKRTAEELVCLWYWMAAAPGSVDDEEEYGDIKRDIAARLSALGDADEATRVREWPAYTRPSSSAKGPTKGASPVASSPKPPTQLRIEEIGPRWFSAWWGEDGHHTLTRHLAAGGEAAWREVCCLLADKVAKSDNVGASEYLTLGEEIVEFRPKLPEAGAFRVAADHLAQKVRFQPPPPAAVVRRGTHNAIYEVLIGLLADGLTVRDVETVRRTLRSLAALIVRPATKTATVRELTTSLQARDVRLVQMALLLLRRAGALPQDAEVAVAALGSHPDAWCRYLSCQATGAELRWPAPRSVTGSSGIVAPEIEPQREGIGAAYYWGKTEVREVMLRKLGSVADVDDETLREWFETELRVMPEIPPRRLGVSPPRGRVLSDGDVSAAAGRLASRLASQAPPEHVPAILAAVSGFDPWLALEPPSRPPPNDWVELCRTDLRHTGERGRFLLRARGLIPRAMLPSVEAADRERFAKAAWHRLQPRAPAEHAWVAERWSRISAPTVATTGFTPLAMHNAIFTCLSRDRFDLIPSFGHPLLRGLTFETDGVPAWVDVDLGPVIVAAHGEEVVAAAPFAHSIVDWWTGWYVSPEWLNVVIDNDNEHTSTIQVWREEEAPRAGRNGENTTVTYNFAETDG